MSSIFLVPTKKIFKNYNTWSWPGLAVVELHSKEEDPVNKLVKQTNRTLNYKNKCDFIFWKNTYFLFNVVNTFSKLLSACIADVI